MVFFNVLFFSSVHGTPGNGSPGTESRGWTLETHPYGGPPGKDPQDGPPGTDSDMKRSEILGFSLRGIIKDSDLT